MALPYFLSFLLTLSYLRWTETTKSLGFSSAPHVVHLPLDGLSTSLTDFNIIILCITDPHLLHTTSTEGNDISFLPAYLPCLCTKPGLSIIIEQMVKAIKTAMNAIAAAFVPTLTFSTVSERKEKERKYRRKDILIGIYCSID